MRGKQGGEIASLFYDVFFTCFEGSCARLFRSLFFAPMGYMVTCLPPYLVLWYVLYISFESSGVTLKSIIIHACLIIYTAMKLFFSTLPTALLSLAFLVLPILA